MMGGYILMPNVNSQRDLWENPFDAEPLFSQYYLGLLFRNAEDASTYRMAFLEAREKLRSITDSEFLNVIVDARGRFLCTSWRSRLHLVSEEAKAREREEVLEQLQFDAQVDEEIMKTEDAKALPTARCMVKETESVSARARCMVEKTESASPSAPPLTHSKRQHEDLVLIGDSNEKSAHECSDVTPEMMRPCRPRIEQPHAAGLLPSKLIFQSSG